MSSAGFNSCDLCINHEAWRKVYNTGSPTSPVRSIKFSSYLRRRVRCRTWLTKNPEFDVKPVLVFAADFFLYFFSSCRFHNEMLAEQRGCVNGWQCMVWMPFRKIHMQGFSPKKRISCFTEWRMNKFVHIFVWTCKTALNEFSISFSASPDLFSSSVTFHCVVSCRLPRGQWLVVCMELACF